MVLSVPTVFGRRARVRGTHAVGYAAHVQSDTRRICSTRLRTPHTSRDVANALHSLHTLDALHSLHGACSTRICAAHAQKRMHERWMHALDACALDQLRRDTFEMTKRSRHVQAREICCYGSLSHAHTCTHTCTRIKGRDYQGGTWKGSGLRI